MNDRHTVSVLLAGEQDEDDGGQRGGGAGERCSGCGP
jgi:hypothetical protein